MSDNTLPAATKPDAVGASTPNGASSYSRSDHARSPPRRSRRGTTKSTRSTSSLPDGPGSYRENCGYLTRYVTPQESRHT